MNAMVIECARAVWRLAVDGMHHLDAMHHACVWCGRCDASPVQCLSHHYILGFVALRVLRCRDEGGGLVQERQVQERQDSDGRIVTAG